MIWITSILMLMSACSLVETQSSDGNSAPAQTASFITPAVVEDTPVIAGTSETDNSSPSSGCNIGLGLRVETIEVLLKHKNQIGFVMSANSSLAEQYFAQFEGAIRVIGAPSLNELEQKGKRAATNQTPYEGLAYGLETGKSRPDEEWQNLVDSTENAKAMADEFNKLLVMGPGFKLLSQNEDSYGPMGALADIWMLQTQQLQKGPPDSEYRREVERIIKLIRTNNPDIEIWAQITLPPDRVPDAEEWLAYHAEITDLVDGVYIGVYTWDRADQDQLIEAITKIIASACSDQ